MARGRRRLDNVAYLAIDLNDGQWPELERRITSGDRAKALVLMEGVSPYIESVSFGKFLQLLSTCLMPGSRLAYDFKIPDVNASFGCQGRTQTPFRLTTAIQEVTDFHKAYKMHVKHVEGSAALCARIIPDLDTSLLPAFVEDGLAQLIIA
jgi:O-methyltransferase involved in polyketide biosynthesis